MPSKIGYRKKRGKKGKRIVRNAARSFKKLKRASAPRKRLMCGQGSLTDGTIIVTQDPAAMHLAMKRGITVASNTVASSWNRFPQGVGEREFIGRYVTRTGLWMRLRIRRLATDTNTANKKVRIMILERKREASAIDDSYMPSFDGRIRKEFYEFYRVKFDRKYTFGAGFYAQGVETSRDITIRAKVARKLDMSGATPAESTSVPVAVDDLPHNEIGRLDLYVICASAPVASTIFINVLDWDMWFSDQND